MAVVAPPDDAAMLAALEQAVDAVVALPLQGVWPDELQARIAAVAPLAQRLAGFVQLAAGRLSRATGGQLPTDDGGSRSVAGWVAQATRCSPAAAGSLLRTAAGLEQLPLIGQAVLDGTVTPAHAQVLTRLVGRIEPSALTESEPALLQMARLVDPAALGSHVRHLLATWCEPALDSDAHAARARRSWISQLEPDGMLRGRFALPAEDAEVLLTVLEPLARRHSDTDQRTAAQRRADAAVEVFEQAARAGALPDTGGARPQLTYVLPADWAARQTQRATCPLCARCPTHRPATLLVGCPACHGPRPSRVG